MVSAPAPMLSLLLGDSFKERRMSFLNPPPPPHASPRSILEQSPKPRTMNSFHPSSICSLVRKSNKVWIESETEGSPSSQPPSLKTSTRIQASSGTEIWAMHSDWLARWVMWPALSLPGGEVLETQHVYFIHFLYSVFVVLRFINFFTIELNHWAVLYTVTAVYIYEHNLAIITFSCY